MTAVGVVWDPVFREHVTDAGLPEHPRRIEALYRRLADPSVAGRFTRISPPMADDAEILRIHSADYLQRVKATAAQGQRSLSADTLTCGRSYAVAAMAAGGAVEAVRQVADGVVDHALVVARPPGHHAERSRAMGYCIFNNVAIAAMAARTALGFERVMVVDWDLHHGNGTQHAFERDPTVFFFSSHQFPFYPGTGHLTETGLGAGEGTTMNVPLARGFGDGEFLALYRHLLVPAAMAFNPQLILVSAGFDIHAADPLGGMRMTSAGFAALSRLILEVARDCCGGRAVFCLEGGYDAAAVADSVLAMLDELTGRTVSDVAAVAATADRRRIDPLVARCRQIHQRFWNLPAA